MCQVSQGVLRGASEDLIGFPGNLRRSQVPSGAF